MPVFCSHEDDNDNGVAFSSDDEVWREVVVEETPQIALGKGFLPCSSEYTHQLHVLTLKIR